VQKFSEDGTFLATWGQFGCTSDLDGHMAAPRQIAVDRSGNLMVTDSALACGVLLVHVFDPLGTQLAQHRVWVGQGTNFTGGLVAWADSITVIVQTSIVRYSDAFAYGGRWGGQGSAPGEFVQPYSIATGNDGSFFVTDFSLNRVTKLDASGGFVTMWGAAGSGEGQFDGPRGIATDASGLVYVVDRGNNRIQVFDSSGLFVAVLGPTLSVGGQLSLPGGVAITPQGALLVTDSGNNRIVKLAGAVRDGGVRAVGAESVLDRNPHRP
jgi:DNA-binding beta-propeller fold protein YncE